MFVELCWLSEGEKGMLLTDGSDQALAAAGLAGDRILRPATLLSPDDRKLWRALVGNHDIYRPVPDQIWADPFWSRIMVVHDAPCSQFDTLRDLLGQGLSLPGPVACLAVTGRHFHGHRGRAWVAALGNLHLCVALMPHVSAARFGLAMTMLPAVAVVDAIVQASQQALSPGIKWVNDILLTGRKVAGVLTSTQTLGDRLEYAVLGIGLNVAVSPQVALTPFVPAVGCLQECSGGETLTLPHLVRAILAALSARYRTLLSQGPEALFEAYRVASLVLGREVCIWEEGLNDAADPHSWPPPVAVGRVREIAPDLTLQLTGREEPITKGRLAFTEACPFLAR